MVLEDWPSLPPIRTSSGRDSRVSCETLSFHDSASPSASCPPSSDKPLSARKFDSFFHGPAAPDASPPSTATSGIGYVASSTTVRGHPFSCFFPNKSAPHAVSKALMSPGREGRKGASDVGAVLRSFVGFSGPIHHSGPMTHSRAFAHSSKSNSGPNLGHFGGLKGYSAGSKGHAGSIFTMMPADVVGKKKPPGYESDEPTSPEVTCIGRVRRNKHCKAWDALVKENKPFKRGYGKKPGSESPRRLNFVLTSPRRPEKQYESPTKASPSRWKQPVLHGSGTESQGADLQRQSNVEDLSIDLGRFSAASELSSQVTDPDSGFFSSLSDEQPPLEGAADDGADFPYQRPPPNCLLRMRNTAHSKEHRAYGELLGVASECLISTGKYAGLKSSNDAGLWQRRMPIREPLKLDLKGKR